MDNLHKSLIAKGWINTDPDCNQYRKDLPDGVFLFREDRTVNPQTKVVEIYESEINLENYTWFEIIEACSPFGYGTKQVDDWLNIGEHFELIAECIFEMET